VLTERNEPANKKAANFQAFSDGARRYHMQKAAFAALVLVLFLSCTRTPNMAGTWVGQSSNPAGRYQLKWDISTQGGEFVVGEAIYTDSERSLTGHGTVSGNVSSSEFRFQLEILVFEKSPGCKAKFGGSAQVARQTITGTYSGQDSCAGPVQNVHFSLRKE
jgi:hypothetical protein